MRRGVILPLPLQPLVSPASEAPEIQTLLFKPSPNMEKITIEDFLRECSMGLAIRDEAIEATALLEALYAGKEDPECKSTIVFPDGKWAEDTHCDNACTTIRAFVKKCEGGKVSPTDVAECKKAWDYIQEYSDTREDSE